MYTNDMHLFYFCNNGQFTYPTEFHSNIIASSFQKFYFEPFGYVDM